MSMFALASAPAVKAPTLANAASARKHRAVVASASKDNDNSKAERPSQRIVRDAILASTTAAAPFVAGEHMFRDQL